MGADAVALTMLYKEMGLVIKQAAELDWKPLFMGGDGYSPNIAEIAGEALNGTFWVSSINIDDPMFDGMKEKYRAEYGKEATEIANTISAYDVLLMIAHAIETAGVAEGPAIKEAIENTKNLQVTHFNWTVDKETHNPLNKPGSVFEAKNGKLVFLEQWKPEGAPVK